MNDLCADIGYKSVNHAGEQLCGDHVDVIREDDGSTVIVLADGLGSGVKASILSTLTAKIISTMLARGLSLEDCVRTIVQTLPVDAEKGVAYSTFTILHLTDDRKAELIQYENPPAILIRNNEVTDYPKRQEIIEGKTVSQSTIRLQEDDVFILMSDGCPNANDGNTYGYDWQWQDIAEYMAMMIQTGCTAKVLATMLVDECVNRYGNEPLDDVTALMVRMRKRVPVNLLFGPPADPDDCKRMMSLFFSRSGKHIVCGGTTAKIAADYLHKPLIEGNERVDEGVPPTSSIEGVDLVTEGILTISRVLKMAQDYRDGTGDYDVWSYRRDGASLICRQLFEEATDIHFTVGRAVNPAHQNPDLPINFHIKMNLIEELASNLRSMGKTVKISYF